MELFKSYNKLKVLMDPKLSDKEALEKVDEIEEASENYPIGGTIEPYDIERENDMGQIV